MENKLPYIENEVLYVGLVDSRPVISSKVLKHVWDYMLRGGNDMQSYITVARQVAQTGMYLNLSKLGAKNNIVHIEKVMII